MALVTFRQIRYFIAVAESGKISAAASMLGISPSVVTEAVSELETLSRMKLLQPTRVDLFQPAAAARPRSDLRRPSFPGALPQYPVRGRGRQRRVGAARQRNGRHAETCDHHYGRGLLPGAAFIAFSEDVSEYSQCRSWKRKRLNLEAGLIDGRHDLALMLVSNLSNRQKLLSHTLVHSMRRLWLPPKHPLLSQEIVTLADVAATALYPARHRRCRVHDRRLLACAQSAAQHHHSHRIGRGHPQPDRASPRRHNTFRYDVSAVVT